MPALQPDVREAWGAWTQKDETVWYGPILQVILMQVAAGCQWTKKKGGNVLHKRILMDEVKTSGFQLVASVWWRKPNGIKGLVIQLH